MGEDLLWGYYSINAGPQQLILMSLLSQDDKHQTAMFLLTTAFTTLSLVLDRVLGLNQTTVLIYHSCVRGFISGFNLL